MKALEKTLEIYLTGLGKLGNFLVRKDFYTNVDVHKEYKEPHIHGDWRPELKQSIDLTDLYIYMAIKPRDRFRVRQPLRKLKMETNTKYFPTIYQIVESKYKHYNKLTENQIDLSEIHVAKGDSMIHALLRELSVNIFLSEHRLRYQQEQLNRYLDSVKYFKKFSGDLDSFCVRYNEYLQKQIAASHNGLSPKIEENYRRNYYQGETSKVTALTFYLYYKTCSIKKFFGKLFESAHTKPQI